MSRVHNGDRHRQRGAVPGLLAALAVAALLAAACGSGETAAPAGSVGSASGTGSASTAGATAPAAPGTTRPAVPADPDAPTGTVWLCRPGLPDNPCVANFDTSAVAADGTSTVQPAAPASDPPIDCFYVYPTVSQQPGPNADLTVDPAETSVARAQAARFSQVCNVYAPMYRQLTLATIGNRGNIPPEAAATAYTDVENAWRDYLAHDNKGRGVVLIGHSQGAAQLIALIKRQIDGRPDVRSHIVSALLLGGNVTVPTGKDVGGSFDNVPACRASGQTGCVVAYSTFLNPPPANSLFGRARAGLEVLCTNPAALGGGPAPLDPEFQSGGAQPWVTYPGLYTGECVDADGAHVLHVTPTPGPGDTRPVVRETLGPTWGLHLVDVNIALGNLVDVVGAQAKAFHG